MAIAARSAQTDEVCFAAAAISPGTASTPTYATPGTKTGRRLDVIRVTAHDRFAVEDYRRLANVGMQTTTSSSSNPRVRFEDEAVAEYRLAGQYYETRREQLGIEFFDAVDATLDRILELPRAGTLVPRVPDDLPVQRRAVTRSRITSSLRPSRFSSPTSALSRAAWRHNRTRHAGTAGRREPAKGVGSNAMFVGLLLQCLLQLVFRASSAVSLFFRPAISFRCWLDSANVCRFRITPS